MVNFIVLNNSPYQIGNIDVTYVDEQSMDNQQAAASIVTVLSDPDIPSGTAVSTVTVEGVEIADEPTQVPLPTHHTIIVSLMYYTNPKSGQSDVVGMEAEQTPEG